MEKNWGDTPSATLSCYKLNKTSTPFQEEKNSPKL